MDLNSVAQDITASDDGTYFPFDEDCKIKIAQWGNKSHSKFLRELRTKYGRKIQAKAISEEQSNKLLSGQWQHIVKDWEGLTLNGEEVPYSVEAVNELAAQPIYDKFFLSIEAIAREEENYRVANIQELGEI